MDWLLIVTNPDIDRPKATEGDLRDLTSSLRRDELIGFTLQLLGALNCDKAERYDTVNRRFVEWAGPPAAQIIRRVRERDPNGLWRIVEPWQQLLLLRSAIQHGGEVSENGLDSAEGREQFLRACLAVNDLAMPPAPPLTGEPIADGLIAAAAITPRLWVVNPPNINTAVARMITFLTDLPAQSEELERKAATLRTAFEEALGVPFEEALDLTAFVAYWGLVTNPEQALADPTSTLIDRERWLRQTNFPEDVWRRYLARVSLPLQDIAVPVRGAASPWFDPLRFRDRPLIELPNELLAISMPDLVAEKCSFDMFWWLTEGPGGAPQRAPWQAAFGALCERYVLRILESIVEATGGVLIPNRRWEEGEVDALYWADGRLVVIEASASFAHNAGKMSGDAERFRQALCTAFVERLGTRGPEKEAVSQLGRDIAWLNELRRQNADFEVPLRRIEHVHPVVIAPDRVVRTHNVWRYLDDELRRRLPAAMSWDVAPLAVFGLEELEELEELVRRRDERLLQGPLPALLHFLRLWQFDAGRYRSLWQFIADHFPGDFGSQRLRDVFQRWRERSAERFRRS